MVRLYLRNLRSFWFILFLAAVVQMFFFYYSTSGPIDYWMIWSQNIKVYVNTSFLVFSIYNVRIMKRTHMNALIRLGNKKILVNYLRVSILNLLIYLTIVYALLIMLNFNSITNINTFIFYLFGVITTFSFYELIYIRFIITTNDHITVFSPLLINFALWFLILVS